MGVVMNKVIFNSTFEVSMRLLLLLNIFSDGLDFDRVLYYDFFTVYSRKYGFGADNLNGDGSYMINELTAQRELITGSIKELVLMGLIDVKNTETGFLFKINTIGSKHCLEMCTEYANQYQINARAVEDTTQNMSIKDIKAFAQNKEDQENGTY